MPDLEQLKAGASEVQSLCNCGPKKLSLQNTMVCQPPHSPSTHSLARPPHDVPAANWRARSRSSRPRPHPGRREHIIVPVGMLRAHNGTQHQQKHKNTPQASEQPIPGSFPRARTRRDPCRHGSPIVRARPAPHNPLWPSIAQFCIMSAQHSASCHTLLHTCTTATRRESTMIQARTRERTQRLRPQHAQRRAKAGHSQRHTRRLLFLACCPANLPRD